MNYFLKEFPAARVPFNGTGRKMPNRLAVAIVAGLASFGVAGSQFITAANAAEQSDRSGQGGPQGTDYRGSEGVKHTPDVRTDHFTTSSIRPYPRVAPSSALQTPAENLNR